MGLHHGLNPNNQSFLKLGKNQRALENETQEETSSGSCSIITSEVNGVTNDAFLVLSKHCNTQIQNNRLISQRKKFPPTPLMNPS